MADRKISSLPPGGAPQAGDRVPVARGGTTQHLDYADLVITGPPGPEGPPGPAGADGADAEASLFPGRIVIFPAQRPELYAIRSSVEQVWHTTAPTNAVPFGTIYNDAAGDYIIFPLSARAGTYTVTVYTWRYVGGGSFTLQLASDADPVFQSLTHSPYNASGDQVDTNGATDQHFPVVVCTDLTIPADAEYTLLFLAAGAPSNINLIVLERTGA